MIRLAVLMATAALAIWSFSSWRKAVKISLVLAVFEGALRKWIVPEAQDLIYFVKDAMLLFAYCGFLAKARQPRSYWRLPPSIAILLALAAAYGLLQIFNPNLPSLLLGLLGFRSYFIYVPLALILPAVFPSDGALAVFLQRYLLLCIPTGLLAFAQFFSPASSPLNTYARGGIEAVTSFGTSSYVRVTSTFSYISGYSYYLLASAFLLLAVLSVRRWRFHTFLYPALGLTLIGMFMTGSRGPVYTLALLLPIYWLLYIAKERQTAATVRALFAACLLVAAVSITAPEATGAFRGRALAVVDTSSRAIYPFIAPFESLAHSGLLGRGIGATHQAGVVLMNATEAFWLEGFNTEAESGRVMLELGPLGFLLLYTVRFSLVLMALRAAVGLGTPFHRAMATASLLFMLAQLPGTIVFDPTASLFFWFFVGLLNTAVRLDAITRSVVGGQVEPAPAALRPAAASASMPAGAH